MEDARRRQHIYVTGEIPRVRNTANPWTVSGDSKPLVGNENHFMYVAPEESDLMRTLCDIVVRRHRDIMLGGGKWVVGNFSQFFGI